MDRMEYVEGRQKVKDQYAKWPMTTAVLVEDSSSPRCAFRGEDGKRKKLSEGVHDVRSGRSTRPGQAILS